MKRLLVQTQSYFRSIAYAKIWKDWIVRLQNRSPRKIRQIGERLWRIMISRSSID